MLLSPSVSRSPPSPRSRHHSTDISDLVMESVAQQLRLLDFLSSRNRIGFTTKKKIRLDKGRVVPILFRVERNPREKNFPGGGRGEGRGCPLKSPEDTPSPFRPGKGRNLFLLVIISWEDRATLRSDLSAQESQGHGTPSLFPEGGPSEGVLCV